MIRTHKKGTEAVNVNESSVFLETYLACLELEVLGQNRDTFYQTRYVTEYTLE